MAPSRIPPKEDPPAASTFEEDEDEEEEEESTTEAESEEEEEAPEVKPSAPRSHPQQDDDSESEDDSDDSDSDPLPPNSNGNGSMKRHAAAENGVADHHKKKIKKEESRSKFVILPGEDIEDVVMKRGLDMVEGSKRREFEKRWKDVLVATLKLGVKQNQLMIDQAKSMLAAMDED